MKNKNIKYVITRRISQTFFFLLFLFIIWNTRYPLDSFINPELFFKIDPLVMILTSIAERILLPGLILAIVTLLLTLILGRVFCGWFCPLGAILDFFQAIKIRIGFKRKKILEPGPGKPRLIKEGLFLVMFLCALFGLQIAWILDPITIVVRTLSYNIHPALNSAIDNTFKVLIEATDFNLTVESIYQYMRQNWLVLESRSFPHGNTIFVMFVMILFTVFIKRRFWCRYLCPLGGLLSKVSAMAFLQRDVRSCKHSCNLCKNQCRMNAIRPDNSYEPGECIVCLDCIAVCPGQDTVFSFNKIKTKLKGPEEHVEVTRKAFLSFSSAAVTSCTVAIAVPGLAKELRKVEGVIRPPGALIDKEFVQRCIRCGNCMKVCPTNVLKPAFLESGINGVWTPYLDTKTAYCEFRCTLCGQVCPTGAIEELTKKEKMKTVIGLAKIDEKKCIPFDKKENCIVCEEHCPVGDKAIKFKTKRLKSGYRLKLPYVIKDLCVGCGICEVKCPVTPKKAIVTYPPILETQGKGEKI